MVKCVFYKIKIFADADILTIRNQDNAIPKVYQQCYDLYPP